MGFFLALQFARTRRDLLGSETAMSSPNSDRQQSGDDFGFAEKPLHHPSRDPSHRDDVPEITLPEPTHMEVFWAWERLRLLFNLLLTGLVVLLCIAKGFSPLAGLWFLPQALVANIGFCVGPVCEGYAAHAGMPRQITRIFMFCAGLLFAAFAAIEIVTSELARIGDR